MVIVVIDGYRCYQWLLMVIDGYWWLSMVTIDNHW
jgi:hypothetical protein